MEVLPMPKQQTKGKVMNKDDEGFVEFERGRAWQMLQKYSLRFAANEKIETVKSIWCEVANECEKKFKAHQKKLKELTKKPKN